MLLSSYMTNFEIASIILGVLTSIGTIGATIGAVISAVIANKNTKYLTQMQYNINNLEDVESAALGEDKADIIFTNTSSSDSLIEKLVCKIGDVVYDSFDLILDNMSVKLPVILKPQHSIKIKSIKKQAAFYFSVYKCKHVLPKRNVKLQFIMIDSQANEVIAESKHRLNDYSDFNFFSFNRDLYPEFFEKVQSFVKNSGLNCIYMGTTIDNFSLYCFNDNNMFSEILSNLEKYLQKKYAHKANKFDIWSIAVCCGLQIDYYFIHNWKIFDEFCQDLSLVSEEIRYLEMEYFDINSIMMHHKLTNKKYNDT